MRIQNTGYQRGFVRSEQKNIITWVAMMIRWLEQRQNRVECRLRCKQKRLVTNNFGLSASHFQKAGSKLENNKSFTAVFRIHDILVWIRIRGSMPLTNGSGSECGSCCFRHWPSRRQEKTNKKSFSVYYFLKVNLHLFPKIEVRKQ